MAITGGTASFVANSKTASAADFGRRMGVQASRTWELGDPTRQPNRERDHAAWVLDRGLGVEDQSLDTGLLQLLAVFDGHEADLLALSAHYDMYVQCHASSDSAQGGFVLGATVMRLMGQLGLDLHCTIFLEDDTTEQS